jgi:hypothetical protein
LSLKSKAQSFKSEKYKIDLRLITFGFESKFAVLSQIDLRLTTKDF